MAKLFGRRLRAGVSRCPIGPQSLSTAISDRLPHAARKPAGSYRPPATVETNNASSAWTGIHREHPDLSCFLGVVDGSAAADGMVSLGSTLAIRYSLAAWLQSFVRLPDWKRTWWLLPFVDIIEGITFIGAYTGRTIYWAGRSYHLMSDGTLANRSKNPTKDA